MLLFNYFALYRLELEIRASNLFVQFQQNNDEKKSSPHIDWLSHHFKYSFRYFPSKIAGKKATTSNLRWRNMMWAKQALAFHWIRFIFIHFSFMVAKITISFIPFFSVRLPDFYYIFIYFTVRIFFSQLFRKLVRKAKKFFSKPKRKFANSFKFWQPIYTDFKFEKLLKGKHNKFPCDFNSQLKKAVEKTQVRPSNKFNRKRILNGRSVSSVFFSFSMFLKWSIFYAIVIHSKRFRFKLHQTLIHIFLFSIFTIDLIFGQCSSLFAIDCRSSFEKPIFLSLSTLSFRFFF